MGPQRVRHEWNDLALTLLLGLLLNAGLILQDMLWAGISSLLWSLLNSPGSYLAAVPHSLSGPPVAIQVMQVVIIIPDEGQSPVPKNYILAYTFNDSLCNHTDLMAHVWDTQFENCHSRESQVILENHCPPESKLPCAPWSKRKEAGWPWSWGHIKASRPLFQAALPWHIPSQGLPSSVVMSHRIVSPRLLPCMCHLFSFFWLVWCTEGKGLYYGPWTASVFNLDLEKEWSGLGRWGGCSGEGKRGCWLPPQPCWEPREMVRRV